MVELVHLPLGNMDGSSRVSNITSSSSISTSNSRDSSRGQASDVQRTRGRDVRVSSSNMVSKTGVSETRVSETSVSQSSVSKTVSSSVVGISISISLPLGDMNGSSRVGDIASSSSVKSSDSRDSSRGQASDVHRGRGRDTGISSSMVDTVSKAGVSETSVSKTSISETVSSSVVRISLPLGNMDGSSRVSNITSSSSVKSSDSRDSSRG